jgi:hypothetical protein
MTQEIFVINGVPVLCKQAAIALLGGTVTEAANALDVSYVAIRQWPEYLSPRISQRVIGAALVNGNMDAFDVAVKMNAIRLSTGAGGELHDARSHAAQIIDRLGGTAQVARMFGVRMPSVCDWKKRGIPRARMMYLSAVHPSALIGMDVEAATARTIYDIKEAA